MLLPGNMTARTYSYCSTVIGTTELTQKLITLGNKYTI